METDALAVAVAALALASQVVAWVWVRRAGRYQQLEDQLASLQREWDRSIGARLPERIGALEDGRLSDAETMGRIAERLHALRDQLALLKAGL